jgi:pyrroloquinoline quinone biosynthesis protein D
MEAKFSTSADRACPRMRPGVRLTHNAAQGGWILIAPERVFKADPVAVAILNRCDGSATVAQIVDSLAAEFAGAPRDRVQTDVLALLTMLAEKKLIELE